MVGEGVLEGDGVGEIITGAGVVRDWQATRMKSKTSRKTIFFMGFLTG